MARPGARRQQWIFFAGLALIFLAVPAAYFFFFDRAPPPPPPPPPRVERAAEISLGEVSGDVEVRRADGTWVKASQGEKLRRSDAVRTATGAYALLIGGEEYEVKMEGSTEVSVEELTDSISRVMLSNGMATATVKKGARHTFEVRAAGSDAVARSKEGSFSISNNGSGTVAVGAHAGEVEFLGAGKVVIVHAGEESIALPNSAPSTPSRVPNSLLLKVQWPKDAVITSKNKNKTVTITGQTEPGALVHVGGESVRVDSNGRFSKVLRLQEGANAVDVRAHTVGKLTGRVDKNIRLKTQIGKLRLKLPW